MQLWQRIFKMFWLRMEIVRYCACWSITKVLRIRERMKAVQSGFLYSCGAFELFYVVMFSRWELYKELIE